MAHFTLRTMCQTQSLPFLKKHVSSLGSTQRTVAHYELVPTSDTLTTAHKPTPYVHSSTLIRTLARAVARRTHVWGDIWVTFVRELTIVRHTHTLSSVNCAAHLTTLCGCSHHSSFSITQQPTVRREQSSASWCSASCQPVLKEAKALSTGRLSATGLFARRNKRSVVPHTPSPPSCLKAQPEWWRELLAERRSLLLGDLALLSPAGFE